jgi:hypothetical protein
MEKKAERATGSSEKAEELAKDAWRQTEELAAEYEKINCEIYRIPWYRPFKRRSMKRRLQVLGDEYFKIKEEASIKDRETRQIRKNSKNIHNLAEAERISQRLSNKFDDINAIRQWLLKPPICYEASLLKENKKLIPKTKGIYAWYFAHDGLSVPSNSYFKVDDFELLYIGIAGKKPESKGHLRSRISSQHITGNAEGSSLRFNLGILLRRKGFPIELERKGRKRVEWSHEEDLTEWLCNNALVAWIEHKRPWLIEEQTVKNFGHLLPLNYRHNEKNKFAQDLKMEREGMRSEVLKRKKK